MVPLPRPRSSSAPSSAPAPELAGLNSILPSAGFKDAFDQRGTVASSATTGLAPPPHSQTIRPQSVPPSAHDPAGTVNPLHLMSVFPYAAPNISITSPTPQNSQPEDTTGEGFPMEEVEEPVNMYDWIQESSQSPPETAPETHDLGLDYESSEYSGNS